MRPLLLAALALGACADAPTAVAVRSVQAGGGVEAAPGALDVEVETLTLSDPALRYAVAIGLPQLRATGGEPLAEAVVAANAVVRDSVRALAEDFRPEAPPDVQAAYPVEVQGGPGRTFVSASVFSTLIDVYAYTGGAHGNTVFLPITLDLETGLPTAPRAWFREGTPWADTLAAHAERSVLAALAERLGTTAESARRNLFADGLDDLRAGALDATLGADSLFVHVPPYQLSSYAAGSFEVAVPYAAVAPFARPGGVLARLAER